MNVFIREMRAHRKSLIFWSIGMLFMIASGMAKFSMYTETGQSINDLIATMPKSLKAVLGFGNSDLTIASNFYGLLYLYLLVMVTIHASMLGANIIAKEERDKTTEFLMVKPVSRTKIIHYKILAALLNVVIFNLVTLVISVAMVAMYNKGESATEDILILMGGMFIVQLIFLFIGTGIAAISKRPKSSASIATNVLLVTFMISIIADMNSKLDGLKYITPFKYFVAEKLIQNGGFEGIYVVLSVVLIGVFVGLTYVFYNKRDLHV